MVTYVFIQILCAFFALVCKGETLSQSAEKSDKVIGNLFCMLFLAVILYIEGVLK
jgi:hypothetical protein